MLKNKLFDESEDSDQEVQINTNKDYAKSYNKFRQKELLKKYKDRGLDVSESDSSSDSESTDEDELIDSGFDQEFFKALSSLKSKNPAIYDKNTRFFGQDQNGTQKKKQAAKPVTLKDYERKVILENGGKFEDDYDEDAGEEDDTRARSPTYVEEQRRLKAEFKKVINAESSDEEEFGGIFKKRVKSKEQKDKEEEDFTKWLAGRKDDVEDEVKKSLAPLKDYWASAKLPQREKFLRDYILNKGYAETSFADIPTYEEIVGDDDNLSEDEIELEKQEEFEHKFNFRFEEPDADFIKRYPRTIEQSVRKKDDKRKQKRQEAKDRKEQEKLEKMKELEIIKVMKKQEIEEKIQKLKEVTGNNELGFKDDELEDDFDPEEHDRRMQELFNNDYYEIDEGEEKPECPDIDVLKVEDWDNYDPTEDAEADVYEPYCEDDDFNMDCDYDPNTKGTIQKELIDNSRDKRKRKRKNHFMEVIKAEKPAFDPEDEKTYGEYIDEYYKLDCEDVIGDIPCRFKYVETTPNDFGLTIEEILLAKNKELNQWASLKKAVQIRPEAVERKEQKLYKMKATNEFLKKKIFKSLYGEESDDENYTSTSEKNPTNKKAKTETMTDKSNTKETVNQAEAGPQPDSKPLTNTTSSNGEVTKNKKKKKKKSKSANVSSNAKQHPAKPAILPKNAPATNPFSKKKDALHKRKPNTNNENPFNKNKKFKAINKSSNQQCASNGDSTNITDERLKAYGINPRKFHKKQKYGNKQNS